MIPEFVETLKKMDEIHRSKNADYSTDSNRMINFDISSDLTRRFVDSRDQVFAALIGTKLGRLSSLLNREDKPNNESIEDTLIDCANYMILWKCDLTHRKGKIENLGAGILNCQLCGAILKGGHHWIYRTVNNQYTFCDKDHCDIWLIKNAAFVGEEHDTKNNTLDLS